MNSKYGFKTLLENNSFLMVLSILAAVLVWYGVVAGDKEASNTIRNVPVHVDLEDSALARLELKPVNQRAFSVDVEIVGSRAVVGNIKAEDVKIVARLSNVNSAGTFELVLEGSDNYAKGFAVKSTTPETVSMRFDHFSEAKMPVKLELLGLEIPEGFLLNQEYIYPNEITVSGPSTEMEAITGAKTTISLDKPLAQTSTYDTPIVLVDKNGDAVSAANLILSDADVAITLPVLKKKEVPVTIGFVNQPVGFDTSALKYTINPPTIELAGPVATINNLTELHLGYIDIRTLEPDTSLIYSVPLAAGYISVDNTQNISVEFDGEGIGERLLNITDVRLINNPTDYAVSIQTKTIYGVTVFGPQKQLDKLVGKDLVAQIDIADVDLKSGTATVPVSVLIPGANGCWAYGDGYTAVITIREK